jgi:hypothetical protein
MMQILLTPPKPIVTNAEIHAEIDDRLPYRRGWPILPVLSCTNKLAYSPYCSYLEHGDVGQSITSILHDVEIRPGFRSMHCRQRCCYRVRPSWSASSLQIRVDISANSCCVDETRKIKRYFIKADVDIAMIEIPSSRMARPSDIQDTRYTGLIASHDSGIIQLWQAKKRFVVRCLDEVQWASIDFVLRGSGLAWDWRTRNLQC